MVSKIVPAVGKSAISSVSATKALIGKLVLQLQSAL